MRRPNPLRPGRSARSALRPVLGPGLGLCLGLTLGLGACGSDSGSGTDAGGVATPDPTTAPAGNNGSDGSGGGAAGISPIGGGGGAIGTIQIEITRPDTDAVSYTIGCLGDTFPVTPAVDGIDGATACERLGQAEVLARLTGGPVAGRACTEIYGGPDVATLTGELNGETIDATVDRANGCGVSDWDDLLAGVLPPAQGV